MRDRRYKTELIKLHGPWRAAEQLELATLRYVHWYNCQQFFDAHGHVPPAELETAYHRQNTGFAKGRVTPHRVSGSPGPFTCSCIGMFAVRGAWAELRGKTSEIGGCRHRGVLVLTGFRVSAART